MLVSQEYMSDDGWIFTHSEEPSRAWEKLRRVPLNPGFEGKSKISEAWENKWYDVTVERHTKGFFIKNSPYVKIGIVNADQTARHDWRDFQHIKNDVCGRDWEGIELYPAESRLKDPSNKFYLWCVPRGVLKFGIPGNRRVLSPEEAIAPQRPFS